MVWRSSSPWKDEMTKAPPSRERNPGKLEELGRYDRYYLALCVAACWLLIARSAWAQQVVAPPPTSVEYLQYGVSLHTMTLLDGGSVCPDEASPQWTPCILGSGGGLGLRVGYRSRGPFYLGAAFQLSRLNSSNLLRLGIQQRLTAEGRYYFDRGNRLTPYLSGALGGALYGNEFAATAAGLAFGLGVGLEYQISERTVVALLPTYQPVLFRRFTDTIGQERAAGPLGFGLAHWLAVQIVIEVRDPLSRW
jgi:opacity protein-like surface antigen